MRNLVFVVLAALLLVTLVAILFRNYLRTRRAARESWDDLLRRLTWVDRDNIAMIALDIVTESGEPRSEVHSYALEPSAIWTLLGGLEGLTALEKNCQVLVELAAYVQKWYPEALVVAEQLRLNAREIEWHAEQAEGSGANRQPAIGLCRLRPACRGYVLPDDPACAGSLQACGPSRTRGATAGYLVTWRAASGRRRRFQ